jgi:hypothetical protein
MFSDNLLVLPVEGVDVEVEVEIEMGRGEGTVLSTPTLLVAVDDVVVVILWYGCCVLCRVLHLTGILFS